MRTQSRFSKFNNTTNFRLRPKMMGNSSPKNGNSINPLSQSSDNKAFFNRSTRYFVKPTTNIMLKRNSKNFSKPQKNIGNAGVVILPTLTNSSKLSASNTFNSNVNVNNSANFHSSLNNFNLNTNINSLNNYNSENNNSRKNNNINNNNISNNINSNSTSNTKHINNIINNMTPLDDNLINMNNTNPSHNIHNTHNAHNSFNNYSNNINNNANNNSEVIKTSPAHYSNKISSYTSYNKSHRSSFNKSSPKYKKKSFSPTRRSNDKPVNFNITTTNYISYTINNNFYGNNNSNPLTNNNDNLNHFGNNTDTNFNIKTYNQNSLANNIFPENNKKGPNESQKIADEYYFLYTPAKHSENSYDIIEGYGTNTFKGLIRNYNEDRVSVILNARNINVYVDQDTTRQRECKVSYFAIYDGHAGNKCADFLKTNMHQYIFRSQYFPGDPLKAIEQGFAEAEKSFFSLINKNKSCSDFSGSCAIIILIINNMCYCANLGDSRALYSECGGQKLYQISRDQKPNDMIEKKRIMCGGGSIYQTPGNFVGIVMPFRILPGKLSVARALGDVEAKLPLYGGNPKVLISQPCVTSFEITSESDFIVMGCDGIFDRLTNEEIFDVIWRFKDKGSAFSEVHDLCGKITDAVMKLSLKKYTSDNITCIFICFENFKKKMSDVNFENCSVLTDYSPAIPMKGEVDLSGFDFATATPIKKFKLVMPVPLNKFK